MQRFFCLIMFILPALFLKAEVPESVRLAYANQFNNAFQLQAMGRSTMAMLAFNDAHATALRYHESPEKIESLLNLFKWYRIYGYSAGLSYQKSTCEGEYLPFVPKPNGKGWTSEYFNDQAFVTQFLLGVGQVVSGFFCVCIGGVTRNSNALYFGAGTALSGVSVILTAFSSQKARNQDSSMRQREFEAIMNQLKVIANKS